jgi:hypothetical protein
MGISDLLVLVFVIISIIIYFLLELDRRVNVKESRPDSIYAWDFNIILVILIIVVCALLIYLFMQ